MNDFGRRLEAALTAMLPDEPTSTGVPLARFRDAVRAANAQCSAPALGTKPDASRFTGDLTPGQLAQGMRSGKAPDDAQEGASGARVDLADALDWLRSRCSRHSRALLSRIESLERDAERYRWLMDEGSGNSPLARANRIYAQWNGEDGAEGFSRVVDAARKEGK